MIRFSLLCVLFTGFNFSSSAQVQPKELEKLKVQLSQATEDSIKRDLNFMIAIGYRFSNVDSSLFYADRALAIARKNEWKLAQSFILSLKGAILLEQGKLPESLQCQFEALKLNDDKDIRAKAYIINRIGNTYMELGNYQKANEYYFLSKNLFESANDTGMAYNEISNIGNIYELLGIPDSALYYQQMTLEASYKTADRNAYVRPEIMFRMGNAYVLKGENEKALDFYKKGVAEAYFDNDIRNLTMNNLFIAKLYNKMGQADSSLKYAYSAVQSGNSITFRKGVYEASLLISDLYKNRGRYDSAYQYLLNANIQKDSLTGTGRVQELQRILLDEQERLREAEVDRVTYQNRQRQIALIAGLGVFLIIASILYRNNRQKQKTNKVLATTLDNLKSTQSQLIHAEKMASLGELTAGIAHEIQNPLNFVNNFSEVNKELLTELKSEIDEGNLQNAKQLADTLIDNETKIIHHGKRADSIVKGMLQHSRTSSGIKEQRDINMLTDEYLKLAYHGLRAKDKTFNASLKTDYDPAIKMVPVIPQEFGRVILNLVTNAFYAVTEREKKNEPGYTPTVWVSTHKLNNKIEIRVRDNGDGIPDDVLSKIFQPFFTTKPTGAGTGLGLSISYDVITKSHNGELKVKTTKGEGSEFIIQLPAGDSRVAG